MQKLKNLVKSTPPPGYGVGAIDFGRQKITAFYGEVAEWLKAPVSKTGMGLVSIASSNLALSARFPPFLLPPPSDVTRKIQGHDSSETFL